MVCPQVIGEDSIVASAGAQGNFELNAIAHRADDEGTTLREAALALGVSAADFDRIVDPAAMVGDPRRDLRRLAPATGRKGS